MGPKDRQAMGNTCMEEVYIAWQEGSETGIMSDEGRLRNKLRYVTIEEYELKESGYTAGQFYKIRGTTIQEDYEEVQRRKSQLKKDTLFAESSASDLHKAWERKKEEE